MDCRNIKTPIPQIEDGKYLEAMFDLQKEVALKYMEIEKLPMWPVNINSKRSQVIIKDFASRVVEELAEGYESSHLASKMLDKVGWNIYRLNGKEYKMVVNHIQNSNEEQADAIGFMLDLLLYTGIQPEDLLNYAMGFEDFNITGPILANLMQAGVRYILGFEPQMIYDAPHYNHNSRTLYELLDKDMFDTYEEYQDALIYCPGFHKYSPSLHHVEMGFLWQIQYHIGVARNYLKNKPWKQSEELSDEPQFYEHIYQAAIKLFGYHALMGLTPETLFGLFFRKNQINRFRQKSNY